MAQQSQEFRLETCRLAEISPGEDFSAALAKGVIPGCLAIQVGELKGWEYFADDEFVDSVLAAAQRADGGREKGLRLGYTHFDGWVHSDPLEIYMGRARNPRREGDQVRIDCHILRGASKEHREKVLGMAEDDPAALGLSISGTRDVLAETNFVLAHRDAEGNFKSPDPRNSRNLPHMRLRALSGIDFVGHPASSNQGLLSAMAGSRVEEIARALCDPNAPEVAGLGELRHAVQQQLNQQGTTLPRAPQEVPMSASNATGAEDARLAVAEPGAANADVLALNARIEALTLANEQERQRREASDQRVAQLELKQRRSEAEVWASENMALVPGLSLAQKADLLVGLSMLPETLGTLVLQAFQNANEAIKASSHAVIGSTDASNAVAASASASGLQGELQERVMRLKAQPQFAGATDVDLMVVALRQDPDFERRYNEASVVSISGGK